MRGTEGVAPRPPGPGRRAGVLRKKGRSGVWALLAVDAAGHTEALEAGKQAIMRRTGLPARDLRILDRMLSYPSTVLGRDRAIVVNLEHIKAIITAEELLLLNYRDPSVARFVNELPRRLRRRLTAVHRSSSQRGMLGGDDADWYNENDVDELHSRTAIPAPVDSTCSGGRQNTDNNGKADVKPGSSRLLGPSMIPFELIAFEACLEAACRSLENETRILEQKAHPAIDKLTLKISTLNLECVRQIKSRLVAITGRVQRVRDELERLLDDDADMAEMYLTEKLLQQQSRYAPSGRSFFNEKGDDIIDERVPRDISLEKDDEDDLQDTDNNDHELSRQDVIIGDCHGTCSQSTHSGSKHVDVEDVEMLLEAYFAQVDGTLNKLSTLREYIDDTEDYLSIMLDDKQNHLLQMGIKLTTATLVVSTLIVVVGIFGMNTEAKLFDEDKYGLPEFLWTVGGGATGSLFLYVIAVAWCKHRRLLD